MLTFLRGKQIIKTYLLCDLTLASNGEKTTDDRMLSSITGYDCKVRRILKEGLEAVCVSLKPNFIIPEEKPIAKETTK